MQTMQKLKARLSHWWYAAGAAVALAPASALAAVPSPPAPSTSPKANDAIAWFKGVFEDLSEVGILIVGVLLFMIGAVGMIWAVVQVLSNKGTIGDMARIGLVSAGGIAFGTYLLTQATGII